MNNEELFIKNIKKLINLKPVNVNYRLFKQEEKYSLVDRNKFFKIYNKPVIEKDTTSYITSYELREFARTLINYRKDISFELMKQKLPYLIMRRGIQLTKDDIKILKRNYGVTVIQNDLILVDNRYDKMTLYHELLHFVLTYEEGEQVTLGGFSQVVEKDNELNKTYISIGTALNEGMTELIAGRLLNKEPGTYFEQCDICKMLELIIGRNNLEKYYFNSDLKELIKHLSFIKNNKYCIDNSIIEFIKNTDIIFNIKEFEFKKRRKEKEFYKMLDSISNILLDLFIKSLIKKYKEKRINLYQMNYLVDSFSIIIKRYNPDYDKLTILNKIKQEIIEETRYRENRRGAI